MTSQDISQLRARWTPELTASAMRALQTSSDPPFAQINGRRDLRGITVPAVLRNIRVSDVDMSACTITGFGQIRMCTFANCLFIGATLESNIRGTFTQCDLSRASLKGSNVHGPFDECIFNEATLVSVMCSQTRFRKCLFVKVNLRKATLAHCSFEDCMFTDCKFRNGSFGGSKFIRSSLAAEDLSNTLMEGVKFEI